MLASSERPKSDWKTVVLDSYWTRSGALQPAEQTGSIKGRGFLNGTDVRQPESDVHIRNKLNAGFQNYWSLLSKCSQSSPVLLERTYLKLNWIYKQKTLDIGFQISGAWLWVILKSLQFYWKGPTSTPSSSLREAIYFATRLFLSFTTLGNNLFINFPLAKTSRIANKCVNRCLKRILAF